MFSIIQVVPGVLSTAGVHVVAEFHKAGYSIIEGHGDSSVKAKLRKARFKIPYQNASACFSDPFVLSNCKSQKSTMISDGATSSVLQVDGPAQEV